MELTVKQVAVRLRITPARVVQLISKMTRKPQKKLYNRGWRYMLTAEHIEQLKTRERVRGRKKKDIGGE